MNLKFYKPTSPSKRNLITNNTKDYLEKTFLIKQSTAGIKNAVGRNNRGKITVYNKGGGHKKKFRKIQFSGVEMLKGVVLSLEYDPNRTANIASVFNTETKKLFYILAPYKLSIGDIIEFNENAKIMLGNRLPISNIPVGCFLHNIVLNNKAQLSKSAGCFSLLLEKTLDYCKIKLSSGEIRNVKSNSIASIGIVSNRNNFLTTLSKAGRSRWLNKRPKVRGVAMNPIDHPHGGGEGKTSGGRTSVTPWGKTTKNKSTSRTKNKLIIQKK